MASKISEALSYEEPSIVTILINTSFLLILNVVNYVLDRIIYCGLLGQIFVGMAWGIPGAKWLDIDFQNVAMSVGYLGLILLVYEGGLSTSLGPLKENLLLSTAVALTGISLPVGLSFILRRLASASSLQAFAAGAALCSTSLGTTFTILDTSGLTRTKLGTVLTSAAMMDDVVGLILVQVISNLGSRTQTSFNSVTVIRPLAVSVGFVLALLFVCRFVVVPMTRVVQSRWKRGSRSFQLMRMYGNHVAFVIHTLVLVGFVTGATCAGTSGLFAAYLAGVAVSWWDAEFLMSGSKSEGSAAEIVQQEDRDGEDVQNDPPTADKNGSPATTASEARRMNDEQASNTAEETARIETVDLPDKICSTGLEVYENYYSVVVQRILKPFFFASIGFAIPITEMFRGTIVWRGIVYTILMLIGKLLTGLWLVRLEFSVPRVSLSIPIKWKHIAQLCCLQTRNTSKKTASKRTPQEQTDSSTTTRPASNNEQLQSPTSRWPKPRSLYPASILGTAMVARGEIGFLVSSLAESKGIYSSSSSAEETETETSDIYLIVTWAIMLCTMIGPLCVGTLVRRLKRLQRERGTDEGGGGSDPLGVWGVLRLISLFRNI